MGLGEVVLLAGVVDQVEELHVGPLFRFGLFARVGSTVFVITVGTADHQLPVSHPYGAAIGRNGAN